MFLQNNSARKDFFLGGWGGDETVLNPDCGTSYMNL